MVLSQPPGIILRILIVLHQRCLNCPECFQRHLMFYTCNYNIRVTHRNGAIKHIFTRIRSNESSSADCSLFILSLHAFARHLAVKILLQILLHKRGKVWKFEYIDLTYICRLHIPHGCQQGSILLRNQHYSLKTGLIFDINHQQNTKRSDQIETINTIMQTTRHRITWKVYQWLRLPFLKKYSIKCVKI